MITHAIRTTWDGTPLPPTERAILQVIDAGDALRLLVFAPFHDDPAPTAPPGPTPGLWEFEVVEWFLAGSDGRYLEVELGPRGHQLVLRLNGVRTVVEQALPMSTTTRRCGRSWWSGTADIPRAWVPPGPHAANAYRIHGQGPARRYDASTPLPGPKPDYHQPARFDAVTLPAVRESTDPRALLVARLVAMLDLTPEQAARAVEIARPAPDDLGSWTVSVLQALGIRREDDRANPDPIG